MKKIAVLTLALMVLMLAFVSCRREKPEPEPTTAEELWTRIDESMNSLATYRVDGMATIAIEYEGIKLTGSSTIEIICIEADENGEPYYYSKDHSEINIDKLNEKQTTDNIIAYSGGKIYIHESEGDQSAYLCSALTSEEFYDFLSDDNMDVDISPESASQKSMVKIEEEKWMLSFSGFSKDKFDEMREDFGFDEFDENVGLTITDISIDIVADNKYRVEEMTISFTADGYDESPLSMTMRYSEFDSAQKAELNESKYEEVEDARIPTLVNDYLSGVIDRDDVTFRVKLDQKVKKDGSTISSMSENNEINFMNNEDGFLYAVSGTSGGQSYTIKYAAGTQKITVSGKTQSVAQSISEARNLIDSMIDPVGYKSSVVKKITKTSDNRYRIEFAITDFSTYDQMFTSLGDTRLTYNAYVDVEMDGKDVKLMITHLDVKGVSYSFVIDSELTVMED